MTFNICSYMTSDYALISIFYITNGIFNAAFYINDIKYKEMLGNSMTQIYPSP